MEIEIPRIPEEFVPNSAVSDFIATPVRDQQSPASFGLWNGEEKTASIVACEEGPIILIGIHNDSRKGAQVARISRDDALWWGLALVDLANR